MGFNFSLFDYIQVNNNKLDMTELTLNRGLTLSNNNNYLITPYIATSIWVSSLRLFDSDLYTVPFISNRYFAK